MARNMHVSSPEDIIRKLKVSYDKFAEDFANTRKDKEWKEVIEYLKSLPSNITLLDAGCGYNRYGKYINGTHVCMDFSKNLIKISMADYQQSIYVVGNIIDLPFKDASFEYSICIATVHHLPSKTLRKRAINELIRVSRKAIFLSVWYKHQKKFENLPKDVDVMWRKKYFRYYHLYDFKEIVEDIIKGMHYKEIFSFVDYHKRNIYVEIVK